MGFFTEVKSVIDTTFNCAARYDAIFTQPIFTVTGDGFSAGLVFIELSMDCLPLK
jgi:hypothetical protein